MNVSLEKVQGLILKNAVHVSEHAYDEMLEDGLLGKEIIEGAADAVVVEDYPAYAKGPCVLVRQRDMKGNWIHALWGIRAGTTTPAVLITVYRPDAKLWTEDFLRRR